MKICVIGGGAAGMMAAISASNNGNEVVLVEKNEKLGKKLFLTGKGRCNLTNSCDTEELFNNIVRNPKFLYSAIYGFDNNATVDFFTENGLKLKEERGGRIFPLSDHSSDVIATLANVLKKLNVKIMLRTEVTRVALDESGTNVTGVLLSDNRVIDAQKVIVATGGKSYPSTGSDGEFFSQIEKMGIKVTELSPSLVPLVSPDSYVARMQGLSLKNVNLTMQVGGKERYSAFGEMLFTHFGVSGPLVLSASTKLNPADFNKKIDLYIDLKPALSEEELDRRILKDFNENQNKIFENVLGKLLPSKMISVVIELSGIPFDKRVNVISREERRNLVLLLKKFPIRINAARGFNEAIITRGGVDVKEINPSTMEAKKINGLYFAGEMIDTDAYTGGFNLQIAWSTGYLAGLSASEN